MRTVIGLSCPTVRQQTLLLAGLMNRIPGVYGASFNVSIVNGCREAVGPSYWDAEPSASTPSNQLPIFHVLSPEYRQFLAKRDKDIYTPRSKMYHVDRYTEWLKSRHLETMRDMQQATINAALDRDHAFTVFVDLIGEDAERRARMLRDLTSRFRVFIFGGIDADHAPPVPLWLLDGTFAVHEQKFIDSAVDSMATFVGA